MERSNATTDADSTPVIPGRWVADPPAGTALVLFGLRVNRWKRVWSWVPLVRSLGRMIDEATKASDESGLLWATSWRDGRTFTVMSYWRDFDAAMRWSQDSRFHHAGVWRRYNRGRVGDSGDIGLWHEVIAIDPERLHTIYRDVESRGLAAATRYEEADAAHLRRRAAQKSSDDHDSRR